MSRSWIDCNLIEAIRTQRSWRRGRAPWRPVALADAREEAKKCSIYLILYPPLSAPRDLSRDANLSATSFRGRGPPRIRLGDVAPPASLPFPAALRA